mgnify:FL=1
MGFLNNCAKFADQNYKLIMEPVKTGLKIDLQDFLIFGSQKERTLQIVYIIISVSCKQALVKLCSILHCGI